MSFDIVEPSDVSNCERILKLKPLDISGNMQAIWEFAQKALTVAQESQARQASKYRMNILYAIGNKA